MSIICHKQFDVNKLSTFLSLKKIKSTFIKTRAYKKAMCEQLNLMCIKTQTRCSRSSSRERQNELESWMIEQATRESKWVREMCAYFLLFLHNIITTRCGFLVVIKLSMHKYISTCIHIYLYHYACT